jgi:hypothetical protein
LASGRTEFSVVSRLDLWKIIGVLVCRNKINSSRPFSFVFLLQNEKFVSSNLFRSESSLFFFTSSSHDGKLKRGKKRVSRDFFDTKQNKLDTAPTSSPNPANHTHTHTPRTLPEPRSRPRYSSAASSRVCYFCAVFYLILFQGTRRIKYKNNSFWNVQRVCVVTILESVGGLSSPPVSRCVRESVKRHSPAPVVLWCPIHRNGRWKKRISVCVCVCVCVGWWCDQESFDSRTLFSLSFLCVLRFLGSRAPESWWATCRYLLLLRIVKEVAWYLNSGKVNRMNKVDDTLLDDEVWPLVPPICETLTTYLTSWINYSSLDWVV